MPGPVPTLVASATSAATATPAGPLPTPTLVVVKPVEVIVAGTPAPPTPAPRASPTAPQAAPTAGSGTAIATPTAATPTSAAPVPTAAASPTASAATATQTATPTRAATAVAATATPAPAAGSIFGVELRSLTQQGGMTLAKQLGAQWLRRNGLIWAQIETAEGARDWSAASGLEQELRDASAQGFTVVLIIRSAPVWARAAGGNQCGPIRADKYQAFAAFVRDAVARYSAAPFNVLHYEIWNEPDVDPSVFANEPDTVFGCLGNSSDAYYGGGAYGELLKAVYPLAKSANPRAQILFGGLLLDCNPAAATGKDCTPAKFLEGALRGGAGSSFDGVSFHGYDFWSLKAGEYANQNWGVAWNTNGLVSAAKATFIRDVLARYGVTGKSLLNTESALVAFGATATTPTNDDFEYTKAVYAAQSAVVALSEGLAANIWYDMDGWLLSGLRDRQGNPTVAYRTYQFAVSKLQGAAYVGKNSQYPNVVVYEFTSRGKRIWWLWGMGKDRRTVALPAAPAAVYSFLGSALAASQSLPVTNEPVLVEFN